MTKHTPVLLKETIEALQVTKGRKYIDATFGLGGHSQEILKQGGQVLGIDLDKESLALREKELRSEHLTLAHGNFADIEDIAQANDYTAVHGVLFDLGLSMWQIRESRKGFSYEQEDELLDMRIRSTALGLQTQTAADIVNSYTEDQLYDIFTKYAEELDSRPIARALVQSRRVKRIETVRDLKNVIQSVSNTISTLARIFQALRVEVNNEFESIKRGLDGALSILAKDGRIVVITFHPSEDRLVKKWIRKHDVSASKKALRAKQGEKFERSALLRVMTTS